MVSMNSQVYLVFEQLNYYIIIIYNVAFIIRKALSDRHAIETPPRGDRW